MAGIGEQAQAELDSAMAAKVSAKAALVAARAVHSPAIDAASDALDAATAEVERVQREGGPVGPANAARNRAENEYTRVRALMNADPVLVVALAAHNQAIGNVGAARQEWRRFYRPGRVT